MPLLDLRKALGTDKKRLASLLHDAEERGVVEQLPGGRVRPADWEPTLAPELTEAMDGLVARLEAAGFQPPARDELAGPARLSHADLDRVLEHAADLDRLAVVGDYVFPATSLERAAAEITSNCQAHGDLSIPDLRDALGTSRKYLLPLLEHFDQEGLTMRSGGRRVLKPT